MTAIRRAGVALLLVLIGFCAGAPWLATSAVSTQHPDLSLAPPSLSRRTLVERLPTTYRTLDDRLPLVWFSGSLVRSADAAEPLLPLGSDSLGRDQWTRLLFGGRLSLASRAPGSWGRSWPAPSSAWSRATAPACSTRR